MKNSAFCGSRVKAFRVMIQEVYKDGGSAANDCNKTLLEFFKDAF
jgi:hypothetical protein